ncbi:MAG: LacI family DNA-binding transcriptional regulator [Clostridiales bacterium]|nr:LacI family DNA-binding transcriptional regulator [Clostridiales bacterium]
MAKSVRLIDIAKRVGVSTVTVSKALSGKSGVSEEMRRKIKAIADEMGYRQPSAQRIAQESKSYDIGVLIAERYVQKYESFYLKMYQQVATVAVGMDCFALIEIVSAQNEGAAEIPKMIRDRKADGIIVIGRFIDEYLDMLENLDDVPLLYLDFFDERRETNAVISDSYYGMYRMTNYLFDMGHRDIAYVGTLTATTSITDRYFGYARAMLQHGVPLRDDWCIPDRDIPTGITDLNGMMKLPEDMPTAFVCNCDLTASELIKKLSARGLRVPDDVSVVGFDNFLPPGRCDVPITTYEVDMNQMAFVAVRRMVRTLEHKPDPAGLRIVEGRMVEKASVRKLEVATNGRN